MANPATGTRARAPDDAAQEERPRPAKTGLDAWMDRSFRFGGSVIKRKTAFLCLLGLPALAPMLFVSPAVIDRNSDILNGLEADVLGTGSLALLILTLTITP